MKWFRLYLPLIALASGGLLWALESKLLVAPIVMLLVWSYWIALVVGLVLTLSTNFIVGLLAAVAVNIGLFLIVDAAGLTRLWAELLYSPVLPLAIVQLVAAPFQFRAVAASSHSDH